MRWAHVLSWSSLHNLNYLVYSHWYYCCGYWCCYGSEQLVAEWSCVFPNLVVSSFHSQSLYFITPCPPVLCLCMVCSLEILPCNVDVNVHPTKHEVGSCSMLCVQWNYYFKYFLSTLWCSLVLLVILEAGWEGWLFGLIWRCSSNKQEMLPLYMRAILGQLLRETEKNCNVQPCSLQYCLATIIVELERSRKVLTMNGDFQRHFYGHAFLVVLFTNSQNRK